MATLKNTTLSDTGFIRLPVGTTGQRPSPAAGQFRYNTTTGGVEVYTAGTNIWQPAAARGVRATGGTVYDVDVEGTTYRVHVFTATGNSTFTVTRPGRVEYLIVAGGGGGGNHGGGGGGAGGLLTGTTTVTPQAYTITVGAGGTGDTISYAGSQNGQNSSFAGLTAIGGGRGNHSGAGANGGSGAGGGYGFVGAPVGGGAAGGQGTPGQGNNGGIGSGITGSYPGGGGGGAGEAGKNATDTAGGNGGHGLISFIIGFGRWYAGGGGGGTRGGVHGLGGFGGGANSPDNNATPNTGGGGTSTTFTTTTILNRGVGGSGIVIIRYPLQSEPDVVQPKVTGDGLVLDLDFAKPTVYPGSGTVVADSRLNGLTGTLTNGPEFTDPRTHRSSFDFLTASAHHISVTPINRTNTMSFEIWFNTSSTSTNTSIRQYIYTQQRNPPTIALFTYMERQGVMITGNVLQTQYFNGTSDSALTGTTILSPNVWYFVSVVINGTNNRMFLNGVLEATNTAAAAAVTVNQAFIGRRGDNQGNDYFGGLIGSVKDYNRALTDAEVSNNFNATRWRFGV
jgi:hypothetical protein